MKSLLNICFYLSLTVPAWTQVEFAPAGAVWDFHYITWMQDTGSLRLTYSGDTTILGKACKRLCINNSMYGFPPDACNAFGVEYLYVTQSDDSVLLYKSPANPPFRYAFKLNYHLGEATAFPEFTYADFEVTQTDSFMIGSQKIHCYKVKHPSAPFSTFATTIYDVFGPALGFFSSWSGIETDGTSYFLRSYKDNSISLTFITDSLCAETVHVNSIFAQTPKLSLSPNPVQDFLSLAYSGYQPEHSVKVIIYDAWSHPVHQENLSSLQKTILVNNLPPGVYFVAVQMDATLVQQKFIKY